MRKKIFISLIIIAVILISQFVATIIVYESIFNYRCTSDIYIMPNMNDYPNLNRKRYEFNTIKNNKLVGYLYSNSLVEEKGVVVFAHGLGNGGQIGYLEIYDYLSSNGYYVFAYDATGNDESEGRSVSGLPQGIMDLDSAINFVKTIEEVNDLPLMLMGFSFGGFSVSNVVGYHDEVKAVVAIAGWNESLNLIEYKSSQYVGSFSKVLLPFVSLYEKIKYGKYASFKAMESFSKTDAKIMIVHSEDDLSVPIEYGYYKYYEKYKSDERFIFKYYTDRGHTGVYYSDEGRKYYKNFVNQLNDYKIDNPDVEDVLKYINANLDRKKLINKLDYDLFDEIIELYDSCL